MSTKKKLVKKSNMEDNATKLKETIYKRYGTKYLPACSQIRGGLSSDTNRPIKIPITGCRTEHYYGGYLVYFIDIDDPLVFGFDTLNGMLDMLKLFYSDENGVSEQLLNGEIYKENNIPWETNSYKPNTSGSGYYSDIRISKAGNKIDKL